MSTTKHLGGRFCNKVIINLCFSILAEQNDLYTTYDYEDECKNLGVKLYCGINSFHEDTNITDDNFVSITNKCKTEKLKSNIKNPGCYYQTKEISNFLYDYYRITKNRYNVINSNKFFERYNNNNDIFVHIRLGDVTKYNPGYIYYEKAIKNINKYSKIYISSDTIENEICQMLIKKFNAVIIQFNEVDTIHFGSTCKNVILSHGSFSCVIGYLSFFSNIYYPEYECDKIWYGDIFSIDQWNKVCKS